MPLVTTTGGYTFKSYPVATFVTANALHSPDGQTSLNVTDNHLDGAHLILHGDLPASQNYIQCEKVNGSTPFLVKSDGAVETPDVKTSTTPSLNAKILDITSDITYNEQVSTGHGMQISVNEIVCDLIRGSATATSLAVANSIVKRNTQGATTDIALLKVNQIQAVAPNPDITMYGRGAVTYVPQDVNDQNITGTYRFGKSLANIGDYDPEGPGDGLYFERNNNTLQCEVQQDAPTIVMKGQKTSGVDYLQIRDENDVVLFAVKDDGMIHGNHLLQDIAANIQDIESNSLLIEPHSLYIGPIRVSYDNGKLVQKHITTIPIALQGSPYNVTNSDLGGRQPTDLSCRQWVVLGRIKSGDSTIRAQDIFPSANESEWTELGNHHANDLTSGAQAQIDVSKQDIVDLETLTTQMDTDLNAAESTLLLKAPLENPTFTNKITVPKIHVHTIMAQNNHLKLGSEHTNDVNIFLNNQETLQITRSGTECRLTTHGGTGQLRSMQKLLCNEDIDVAVGKKFLVGGVDELAIERSRIDGILNLSNQDLDTLIEIETAFKAADSSIETTVTNLTNSAATDRALIRTELIAADTVVRNFAVAADTVVRNGYIAGDAALQTEVDVNTAKTGITSGQASAITLNTAKTGITSGQASAITANTAKTGITSGQASAITLNTAKTGITSGQASAITANTAKTGISVQQTADITLNNAKVTYDDAATVSSHVTLHTQHTTALGNKINTSGHQTMDGRLTVQNDGGNGVVSNSHADDLSVYHWNDCGITIGAPHGKIGTLAFSDNNKADRNQIRAYSTVRDSRNIGIHMLANQVESAVPTMSVCSQVVGINNAQPSYPLDVTGDINLSGDLRIGGTVQSFGGTSPTFLSQNNDASTRSTFSGLGYNTIDLRELTTDETEVICFTTHNGATHMGVQMPLLSTVTPGSKFTVRNLSANHNLYMNTHPSDANQNFVIKWSATNPQVKSSPWSIGDSKRAIELFAYRSGSEGSYSYRWITVEIDTN